MASSLLATVLVTVGGRVISAPILAAPWAIMNGEPLRDSRPQALELTQHLLTIGARLYGAWTCPAYFKQMNLFGKQAGEELPYLECQQPKQLPEQAEACNAEDILAYPNWFLPDGRRKVGVQSLEALSLSSGLS